MKTTTTTVESVKEEIQELRKSYSELRRRSLELSRTLLESEVTEGQNPDNTTQAELRQKLEACETEMKELDAQHEALKEKMTIAEIKEMVGSYIAKVTKYRPMVKELINEHRGEVADILKDLINVGLDIVDDLAIERKRMLKLKAVTLWDFYNSLTEVGFDKKEAMQIILSQGNGSGLTNLFTKAGEAFSQGVKKNG